MGLICTAVMSCSTMSTPQSVNNLLNPIFGWNVWEKYRCFRRAVVVVRCRPRSVWDFPTGGRRAGVPSFSN